MLLGIGREDRVSQLTAEGVHIGREAKNGHISSRGVSFIEVLPAPHSSIEGQSLKELGFRKRYGFTAVAFPPGGGRFRTGVADLKRSPGGSYALLGCPSRLHGRR